MTEYDESSTTPEPEGPTPEPVPAPDPATDPATEPEPEHHSHHGHLAEHLLERLRGTGVGMSDPNIIGDAGPTDVAPGHDPLLGETDDVLPPEEEWPSEQELPADE